MLQKLSLITILLCSPLLADDQDDRWKGAIYEYELAIGYKASLYSGMNASRWCYVEDRLKRAGNHLPTELVERVLSTPPRKAFLRSQRKIKNSRYGFISTYSNDWWKDYPWGKKDFPKWQLKTQ